MKILRLAIDVLFNHIDEHSRDLAYAIPDEYANNHDWIMYIRGFIDAKAVRKLIIEEYINGILRSILTWYKRH